MSFFLSVHPVDFGIVHNLVQYMMVQIEKNFKSPQWKSRGQRFSADPLKLQSGRF